MAAPPDHTPLRCSRCDRPATVVAEVRVARRQIEIPLCPLHRRELLRGARRLKP